MAEECRVGSCVANSSSSIQLTQPNWWDDVHAASGDGAGALSPWANPWQQQHQPNQKYSNSSNNKNNCDDHDQDVSISSASFTNGSNHSSLSVDSSGRLLADNQPSASSNDDLINGGEQVSDNHIWNHVLLSVNGNQDLNHNNDHDVGENFLDALSSKSLSSTAHHQHHQSALYEPAYCDYLKKLDNTNAWEFTNNNFNGGFMDHNNNNMNNNINVDQSERLTKLSNLVSTWSIAPPEPQLVMDHHHHHQFIDDDAQMGIANRSNSMNLLSCYGGHNYLKVDHHQENLRSEYQIGLNHAMAADHLNSKYLHGNGIFMPPDSYSSSSTATSGVTATAGRNFADVISFTSRLAGNNKPLVDIHAPKPSFKSFNSSSDHSKKQGLQTSSSTRTSGGGRGNGITNEGKKKRDGTSPATVVLKKPKQETCTVSSSTSVKMQVPKVKLGDRITALQQIVSPFGKTDTASVLYEAIQYIKFLQDQVNVLLSSPYLKTNAHTKDVWGMERKDHQNNGEGRQQVDLKGRGLCLVPVSCTPQVYRENTGSDYWTPTYRGCLYR